MGLRVRYPGIENAEKGIADVHGKLRGYVALLPDWLLDLLLPVESQGIVDDSITGLICPLNISGGQDKNLGKAVKKILKNTKGSIRNAPLPEGSPAWDDILNLPFDEIIKRAKRNEPGYRTIKKLLSDGRFDR